MSELAEPNVANNQERFRMLMKEQSDLTPIVEAYKEYKKSKQDIEDSLALLDEETDEDMKEAATIAQATEFIDSKKDGYADSIAQGGTNVSGGQKQRLSIARAIAVRPKVYVFDDSFSALDFKTDAALRKALSARTKDASVIIVAQRISTIMNADQIILLNEGKVAGIGTHKELLKNCHEYLEIAKSQLSEAELAGEEA